MKNKEKLYEKYMKVEDAARLYLLIWECILNNTTAKEFKNIIIEYKKRLKELMGKEENKNEQINNSDDNN